MTIGERIKKRREELGLTVAQLANKLGKDRTTVYRYESNYIENMPINILQPLAIALQTTPAYLMGWILDLTDEQYKLLDAIDRLDGKYTTPSDVYQNPLANYENTVEFFIRQKLVEHIPSFYAPSQDCEYFKTTELGKSTLQSKRNFNAKEEVRKSIPLVLQKYNRLSKNGQNKVMQYIDDLLASGNYDDGGEICATVDTANKKSLA